MFGNVRGYDLVALFEIIIVQKYDIWLEKASSKLLTLAISFS